MIHSKSSGSAVSFKDKWKDILIDVSRMKVSFGHYNIKKKI